MPLKLPGIFRGEFLKNVATLVSGTTFVQIIAILIYFVLSRIYTPEDFGLFGLYMSIISITAIIATAKYEMAIMLPEKDEDAINLLGLSVSITLIISLLLLVIILFFNHSLSLILGNEAISPWLYFVPLSTLLVGLFQAFKFYSNRNKKYRMITGANVVQSLTNSTAKVSIGPCVNGPAGLITGTVLGQLAGALIFLIPGLHKNREKFAWLNLEKMRSLSKTYNLFPRFNMIQGMINNFSAALPVFIFNSYFTAAIAGYFTLGYSIIQRPMNLVATAFYQVLSQRIIERYNHSQRIYPDIKKFLYRLLELVTIPFILVAVFAPAIFRVVFGQEWEEAGRYTQIIIPWLFASSLALPLSFIPDMFRRQKKAMILDLIKFILRVMSLIIGVLKNDVYLGLVLFSTTSTIMIMYSLLWYISLVRKSDRGGISKERGSMEQGGNRKMEGW
jgi:O-antigen/teichoic acid export membrane protein